MTPPQPPSQTLRERLIDSAERLKGLPALAAVSPSAWWECADLIHTAVSRLREAESALAAQEASPRCHVCGKPATCIGQYDNMTHPEPACDACCGHGGEDGQCQPIAVAEASPQPDLAREWFEKGYRAAVVAEGIAPEVLDFRVSDSYLAACRQEQP